MPHPKFYPDQIFSAVGHGEASKKFLSLMYDSYHAVRPLQTSLPFNRDTMPIGVADLDDNYFLLNKFALRMEQGAFRISGKFVMSKDYLLRLQFVAIDADGEEQIKRTEVITLRGNGDWENHFDLSSEFNPGNVFEVHIGGKFADGSDNPGSNYVNIDYVGESFDVASVYPLLASFADGTTPTVAEWAALGEAYELLDKNSYGQNPAWVGFGNNFTDEDLSIIEGVITHRNPVLFYEVALDSGTWQTWSERTHRISFWLIRDAGETRLFQVGITPTLGRIIATDTQLTLKDGRGFEKGMQVLVDGKEVILLGDKAPYSHGTYDHASRFTNCTREYGPDSKPAEEHGESLPVKHFSPSQTTEDEPMEPEPIFGNKRMDFYRGLFTLPPMPDNESYRISVRSYKREEDDSDYTVSDTVDTFCRALFEFNDTALPDPWWNAMPDLVAGQPVCGIDAFRDNAFELSGRLVYENRGSPKWFSPDEWGQSRPGVFVGTASWVPWLWINHKFRFLHYKAAKPYEYRWGAHTYVVDSPAPRIIYYYNGWQEIGLDADEDKDKPVWHTYDLSQAAGLWPSKFYQLIDCEFALEHAKI